MSNIIEISGITKTFGSHVAVDNLTLAVPEGCIYGFIGPNGSGKTTTIRMIMNILYPDQGSIRIFGEEQTGGNIGRIGYLPEERGLYRKMKLQLRKNIPDSLKAKAINDLIGYYGHISALDSCIGELQKTLKETGIYDNTIFIFTSDHGAMVRSHGFQNKQVTYEESINVPLLVNYPNVLGTKGKKNNMLINTPDILPTILGLCKLPIPTTIEGQDKSEIITHKLKDTTDAVIITYV